MIKASFLTLCFAANIAYGQVSDFTKSPNSYIFDIDLARTNNFGGIEIPVKKAYAMWSSYEYLKSNETFTPIPIGTQSASLYWEDVPGLIENVEIVPASDPADSSIRININKGKGKGNAVIAFRVDEQIYWTWHIWVTDNPENGTDYTHGYETDIDGNLIRVKYMDRNLGATTNNFLGNDWGKSGGLLYEWGRKDPFPSLVYKDLTYYEISGDVGNLKHRTIAPNNSIPIKLREFDEIEKNIRYSVQNPITYIINSDQGNWFSKDRYKINGTGFEFFTWDLWSDNFKGGNSNASSSSTPIRTDSRSYELKSPVDPCPNGWRIPSYYGRVTVNNNLGAWGRRANGENDDINSINNILFPDQMNPVLDGVKVYPGLGIDFTHAQSGQRNLGLMPMTGNYIYYPNSVNPNEEIFTIYQDENANAGLWSATFGYDGARTLGLISDQARSSFSTVGKHGIFVNQTTPTKTGFAVRCMQDPNLAKIGDFATQYFQEVKENFAEGLDAPNTYLIQNQTEIEIPVSKAFSVYNQILTHQENLPSDHLVAKVLWADQENLITSIAINKNTSDPRKSTIKLGINPEAQGNSVISLHNGSTTNPVYWSWLIWNPEGNPAEGIKYSTEQAKPANYNIINATKSFAPPMTTVFMDRNLGAVKTLEDAVSVEDYGIAKESHGNLYQWGRKDPLPNFSGSVDGRPSSAQDKIFLGNENASDINAISYTLMGESDYLNLQTTSYNTYGSAHPKKDKAVMENILYSINNPLKFLYQSGIGELYDGGDRENNDLTKIKDWVHNERGAAPERWGHGTEKSVFDPCPQGWRIPDTTTSTLYSGSKGNSPWYNSYLNDAYGKAGVIQDQWHSAETFYKAQKFGSAGYVFNSQHYYLGGYPFGGIRGEFGENLMTTDRSGYWTASLADLGTGYALGMLFNEAKIQTATGVYPQAAMSVRCAKDEKRLLATIIEPNSIGGTLGIDVIIPAAEAVLMNVYPNPFTDVLFIDNADAKYFEIYDYSGRLLLKGEIQNKKLSLTQLNKGNYILKVTMTNGKQASKKIMK